MRWLAASLAWLGLGCAGLAELAVAPEDLKKTSVEAGWRPGDPVEVGPAPVAEPGFAELPPAPVALAEMVRSAPGEALHPLFRSGELLVHHQRAEGDHLRLWGVYHNDTPRHIERPSVYIEYFDAEDRRVGVDAVFLEQDHHPAGARHPFAAFVHPVPPHARYTLTVAGEGGIGGGAAIRPLQVVEHRRGDGRLGEGRVGTLRWDGPGALRFVRVHVAWYGADGRVVGAASTYADPSDVQPGQSTTFNVLFAPLAGPFERVEVRAFGQGE